MARNIAIAALYAGVWQFVAMIATSKSWEIHNVEKCLAAGYEIVVAVPVDSRAREAMQVEIQKNLDAKFGDPAICTHSTQENPSGHVLSGHVRDSITNKYVPYAALHIKNTGIGVMTKLDGSFKLVVPDSLLKSEIVLVVRYAGYDSKEIPFTKNRLPHAIDIKIKETRVVFGKYYATEGATKDSSKQHYEKDTAK